MNPIVLTTAQLANRLGVCPDTIHRWVREGALCPPVRLTRNCCVWPWESVRDLVERRESAEPCPA
jgi:predicted site-specific integrase-resolvase